MSPIRAAVPNFEITPNGTAGYWDFWADGNYLGTTGRAHFNHATAAFNGEVDNACIQMAARAMRSSAPLRSLQYATPASGGGLAWHFFVDHLYADQGFNSVMSGDFANDFAYGG